MAEVGNKDFTIRQGKTFTQVLRWGVTPIRYVPITGISQTAPVVVDAPDHQIPDGWPVTFVSVKGMKEINDQTGQATLIDPDKIEINTINAADYKTYTAGGYLRLNTPVDLTGMEARLVIKDKVGGNVLLSLTTTNGGITLDLVKRTINLHISAEETALITWKKGVYELEMVTPGNTPAEDSVSALLEGKFSVIAEIAT